MEFRIVEVSELSGDATKIYSIIKGDEKETVYGTFIESLINDYEKEVMDILDRLAIIGSKTGARESFFKLKEGALGDGVCALYDKPNSNLRLFCIRYGSVAIIIGGGWVKPKDVRAWQDTEKLKEQGEFIKFVSKEITKRIKLKEIILNKDTGEIEGNLNFTNDEHE